MHDALFADGVALDPPGLLKAAATAGLDLPLTQVCIGADGSAKVRADRAAAEAIGLTGTPAFLIGIVELGGVRVTKVLRGAQPFQEFAAALDELLARVAG
jgi:predicted DsbA family dithiol-disulfide isomerase